MVYFCTSIQLAKLCEQLRHVLSVDPDARVSHRHVHHFVPEVKARLHLDQIVRLAKLERVLDQIYEHLFEAPLITEETARQYTYFKTDGHLFCIGFGQEYLPDEVERLLGIEQVLHQGEASIAYLAQVEHVLDEGLHEA